MIRTPTNPDAMSLTRTTDWVDNLCVDDSHHSDAIPQLDSLMVEGSVYSSVTSNLRRSSRFAYGQQSAPVPEEIKSIWNEKLIPSIVAHNHGKTIVSAKRGPGAPSLASAAIIDSDRKELFARKVFVGGLPIDVSEEEIGRTFSHFGRVLVDWPRRPTDISSGNGRHMTGYVFLVFEQESSVQALVHECHHEHGKYYLFVTSPTMRDKPVQVRPWRLSDMDFMLNPSMKMDHRRTVFIGGVPRPTKAAELAMVLAELYGAVCYVGIDIDPELKYPKGAARVTFVTTASFIAAIAGRFVQIPHSETNKRVEIKPYVMDDQMCDECLGASCANRYAQYFCGDVNCLQYYCEDCWDARHLIGPFAARRREHKPLVRQGEQTKVLCRPSHHDMPSPRSSYSVRHSSSRFS